jgi:putative membrane protein
VTWFPGGGGMWVAELLVVAFGIAFWIGLIVLIFLGIRWLLRQDRASGQGPGPGSRPGAGAPPAEDPFEILRRRYAAGEIDDEEYARRRKTLGG